MTTPRSPQDQAIEFCSQKCFHQSLRLPSTPHHPPLRVTFATTTNFDDVKELPVVLYHLPMGASRLIIYDLNHTAVKSGVKILMIDRPGFGGSTPVPLNQRVDTWIEIVKTVIETLKIRKVVLLGHSAGTIYLWNTILKLPELLHPTAPYAAVLAPWTHPQHTSAPLMTVVNKLPSSWIGQFHNIQGFVRKNIVPGLQKSSAYIGDLKNSSSNEEDCTAMYGVSKEVWREVTVLQGQWFMTEDSTGISEEALLCMNKGETPFWGPFNDLPSYIETLQEHLSKTGQKLRLRAFFSGSDIMVGKGGQAYFEQCWEKALEKEEVRAMVDFESKVVEGTNHDNIGLPEYGCLQEILGDITGGR